MRRRVGDDVSRHRPPRPVGPVHEDAGGADHGAGGGSVAERGGLYARTWDDDEPEPRPRHPGPPRRSRVAERDEWPSTLRGLVSKLGPGWTLDRVLTSVGYVPLANAPYRRPRPGRCVFALFRHDHRRVRAFGFWLPKPNADGLDFATAMVWRLCTDPDCATRATSAVHPVDVPAAITSPNLRAILATSPDHMTDDPTTWRPAA